MIRFLLVCITVIGFLILSIPILIVEWIIGKFNPDPFPSRAAGNEFVFDNPLDEVFAIYRSCTKEFSLTKRSSSGRVAGVILSTMLLGNVTFFSIHTASSASCAFTKDMNDFRAVSPLCCKLSQERMVTAPFPALFLLLLAHFSGSE